MEILKKHPFFLILIAFFFSFHGVAENYQSITIVEVLQTGFSVLISTLCLFLILYFLFRRYLLAALVALFISIWFFFFGAIQDFLASFPLIAFLKRYIIIIPLLLIATVLWVYFLKKKILVQKRITNYLNVLLIILCVIDLFTIGYLNFSSKKKETNIIFQYDAVKQKPDIYFMLFDGYPGKRSLSDSFNFDNRELYDYFVKENFISLKISANYDLTHFSMSSMLNMRYVPLGYSLPEPVQKDFQARQTEIKEAEVFSIFEKLGYKIINNSIFDVKNVPGISDENSFLLGHSVLLTDKILINRLNRDIGTSIPENVIKKIPFLNDQSFYRHREDNLKVEQQLLGNLEKRETAVFCYSHFLMPHGPYFYDSTSKEVPLRMIKSSYSWEDKNAFICYLKYTNKVAKKMIDAIKEKKPDAIIIMMSDHGFRSYKSEEIFQEARFNNICSVYFPNSYYGKFMDSITNINFFPYLFNTQFNQKLPYLKDTLIPMRH